MHKVQEPSLFNVAPQRSDLPYIREPEIHGHRFLFNVSRSQASDFIERMGDGVVIGEPGAWGRMTLKKLKSMGVCGLYRAISPGEAKGGSNE